MKSERKNIWGQSKNTQLLSGITCQLERIFTLTPNILLNRSSAPGTISQVQLFRRKSATSRSAMRELYPEIEASQSYRLKVDQVHTIYVEEAGNRNGIPVIFLHGGPGSGCNENHRRYFNPKKYRVVLFDQRGCHRSKPAGETKNNSTPELLQDIERIREHLGIDKWLVFGGSWGATLALLYAQSHPSRVSAMILRGAFLARKKDLDWFGKQGASMIFPDYWKEFTEIIPALERDDLIPPIMPVSMAPTEKSGKRLPWPGQNGRDGSSLTCCRGWSIHRATLTRLSMKY